MEKVDCSGLSCPEPVLKAKEALEKGSDALEVIVDNETARENVLRFIRGKGRQAAYHEEGALYRIIVEAGNITAEANIAETEVAAEASKTEAEIALYAGHFKERQPVFLIFNDHIGTGSLELGSMLIRNFIYTLTKSDLLPEKVVFMNAGVKLCCSKSPALEELTELEQRGVKLLVCGTCLDYFSLKDLLLVGQISNMYDIVDLIMSAPKTVTI